MTETNFRALCAELVGIWDAKSDLGFSDFWHSTAELVDRARAALAQPEPVVVSDEELDELFTEIRRSREVLSWRPYARAVLARWGRPVIEPVVPTDEEIDDWHGRCADLTRLGEADHHWAFDLRHDEVAGVVRAALARWGRPAIEPVPKREGEQ